MPEGLALRHENRLYYFTVEGSKPEEVKIMTYGSPYTLLQTSVRWVNHTSNPMNMKSGLVAAMMSAPDISEYFGHPYQLSFKIRNAEDPRRSFLTI